MDSIEHRGIGQSDQHADPAFRADTDAMGRWFVWERLGPGGWVTIEPCVSCDEATRLADEMNARLQRDDRARGRLGDLVDDPSAADPEPRPRIKTRDNAPLGRIDQRLGDL